MDSTQPDHYENNVAVYNLWGEELVKLDDYKRVSDDLAKLIGKLDELRALKKECVRLQSVICKECKW